MRYHYNVADDVLYLRLASSFEQAAVGEESDDGFILLRDAATEQVIGMTVVNWWKRFGAGELPDSIGEISRRVEQTADRLAALFC